MGDVDTPSPRELLHWRTFLTRKKEEEESHIILIKGKSNSLSRVDTKKIGVCRMTFDVIN